MRRQRPRAWHLMTYDFRMKPGAGNAPKPMMAVSEDA